MSLVPLRCFRRGEGRLTCPRFERAVSKASRAAWLIRQRGRPPGFSAQFTADNSPERIQDRTFESLSRRLAAISGGVCQAAKAPFGGRRRSGVRGLARHGAARDRSHVSELAPFAGHKSWSAFREPRSPREMVSAGLRTPDTSSRIEVSGQASRVRWVHRDRWSIQGVEKAFEVLRRHAGAATNFGRRHPSAPDALARPTEHRRWMDSQCSSKFWKGRPTGG